MFSMVSWSVYSAHPLPKKISKYFPKRLELLFFTVLAFPKDSKSGLASRIYMVHFDMWLAGVCTSAWMSLPIH